MYRYLLLTALSILAMPLAIGSAEASVRYPAGVCTPIVGRPAMTGKTTFSGSTTGTLRVSCPLDTDRLTVLSKTIFTYRDSTGTGTAAHVKMFLRVTNSVTGATAAFLLFNSDSSAATTIKLASGKALTGLIVSDNYYALEVELVRAAGSQVVEFYGYGQN